MVVKKEVKKDVKEEIAVEEPKGVNFATQLVTAIQNLNNRIAVLEIDAKKAAANEQIMDKQIAFLGDRIDFLKEKTRL